MHDFYLILSAQAAPWFNNSETIGAVTGSRLGLFGAILAVALGVYDPRGIGKTPILAFQSFVAILGILILGAGLLAVYEGQPYAVWYPLVRIGTIAGPVFGGLIPATRFAYRQAEQRKLEAEEFHTG